MKKLLDTIEKSFHLTPPKGLIPDTELVPLDGKSEDESLIFGTPDAKGLRPDQMPSDLQQRQDGYCVIGFWGHGINSYAFQYNRKNSWSEFSLRMPYGGVYMDNDAEAAKIADFITKYFAFEQQLIEDGETERLHIAAFDNMGSGYYELSVDGKEPVKYELSFMDQETVQKQINDLLSQEQATSTTNTLDDKLAYCGGGKYKDGVYLDQALAGNHEAATKKLQELEANGKRAKGTGSISGFVTHEFGHLMINDLRTNYPDIFTSTVEPVLKKYAFQGQDWLEQNISTLASGKPKLNIKTDEILAETFAEFKLAKEPREAARELGTAIDTAYSQAHPKDTQSSNTTSNARLDHVKLLTDENTMAANLASSQLSEFIKEVTSSVAEATQGTNAKFQLMLQFELSPSEPLKLEIANKGEVDDQVLQQVYDRVIAIKAPKPSSQAVAFQAEFSIN